MLRRVRGAKLLVHETVDLVVDLVEQGHESTARNVLRALRLLTPAVTSEGRADDGEGDLLGQVDELRRLLTRGTLGTVRGVNHLVQGLTDAGLSAAVALRLLPALAARPGCVPLRSDVVGSAAFLADAAIGALNGAVGDYLHATGNGLDLGFGLRVGDALIALEPAGPLEPGLPRARRVAVFVHGLMTTEWSWCWDAAAYHGDAGLHFGALLQRDLGIAPVYARYNTGRPVRDNGRALGDGLERLWRASPEDERPAELLLIGHSMGGLVARSACAQAARAGHEWVRRVSRVVCLGTPHQGAPLAKLGHALTDVLLGIDLPGTRIPGELLRRRSAGIYDLRHGGPSEPADGADEPLLPEISYSFVSATVTRDPVHPLGQLVGDVLVRPRSAAGPAMPAGELRIRTECFGGVVHHQLQNHPDVYRWLAAECAAVSSGD